VFKITDGEFQVLQEIMYGATGVRLTDTKKALAFYRLRRRLEDLKIYQFCDYIKLLKEPDSGELEVFINAITTNETFFYRHPKQFDRLTEDILPSLLKKKKASDMKTIRIWSAACSTGEEPYSIAIACKLFFQSHPDWNYAIYASDINSAVLDFSQKAQYAERSVEKMPAHLRQLFFSQAQVGEPRKKLRYQLQPEVSQSVGFLKHNLLEPFPYRNFDIIFLRNVMIYFDVESKQRVVDLLEKQLNRGGYFFISLTESLANLRCHMKYIDDGVYQKDG